MSAIKPTKPPDWLLDIKFFVKLASIWGIKLDTT